MKKYDFSRQKEIFEIALQIIEDYNAEEFSFGGGTALSAIYFNHRMSYDIDIFSEDFSFVQNLIHNKEEIAKNLGIRKDQIEASQSGITFVLSEVQAGLKLDFVYGEPLTEKPYLAKTVFGYENIKVQSPEEILSRKIKHRTLITIRDFVDFAYAEENDSLVSKIQKENIDNVDFERYIDIVEQFKNRNDDIFNLEVVTLEANFAAQKKDLENIILSTVIPKDSIEVLYDDEYEVLSFSPFAEAYKINAEEFGVDYKSLTLSLDFFKELQEQKEITYQEIKNIASDTLKTIESVYFEKDELSKEDIEAFSREDNLIRTPNIK